jgi:Uncharacterized protein conserved in bacteria
MARRDEYEAVELADLPAPENEQFRMRKLTVFNWGTFSNVHTIPVAESGMLLIGPSGAGKSTLLDAISVMIVPPKLLHMNAAAEEGDRKRTDRSLLSYIRGAWADKGDIDSREVSKEYLRSSGTRSAIALEYGNRLGRVVTLVRIFWVTGVAATTNVNHHYAVVDGAFSMDELADFDGDLRKLRKKLDREGLRQHDTFPPYEEHWRRIMGIEDPGALDLLHRTQSTKNLGDLNKFLRDFMLKEPATFERAERLVEEFGELDEAHRAVVSAREQIQVLAPAREALAAHAELSAAIAARAAQLEGRPAFESHLRAVLIEQEMHEIEHQLAEDRALLAEAGTAVSIASEEIGLLDRQHREAGGDTVAEIERTLVERRSQRDERFKERERMAPLCKALGQAVPESATAFADLNSYIRQVVGDFQARDLQHDRRRDELAVAQYKHKEDLAQLRAEVATLEGSSSNIPRELQVLREHMCAELNLPPARLMFVGELLQVRPDEHAQWAPAAERLLGGFGRDLIIDAKYQKQVASWVDRTHLGTRLVYHPVVTGQGGPSRDPRTRDSIYYKLELKESVFSPWLGRELVHRFDYQCVRSATELAGGDMRITAAGQMRHSGGRTEKDDRRSIGDRRNWVLGFDSREKLELYRQMTGEAGAALSMTQKALDALDVERKDDRGRLSAAERLLDLRWERINVASVAVTINGLEQQLRELELGNRVLADLGGQLAAARERHKQVLKQTTALELGIERSEQTMKSHAGGLQDAKAAAASLRLEDREAWQARIPADRPPTLQSLASLLVGIEREMNNEMDSIRRRQHGFEQQITGAFGTFAQRWPEESASLQANMDSAPDFLALLRRVEVDGLPEHEARFRALLAQQSTQRLAELSSLLRFERMQIAERLEDVNAGLLSVPYNPGSHLQIRPIDLNLPDAIEFRRRITTIFASQPDLSEDPVEAEAQFRELRELVVDLKSEDPEKRRWRARVLDVRQHVEFAAEELDTETGAQLELFRGSAGKSGGQRQKLTATCLAAALRFKLGGSDGGVSTYAAVVLDEAFTKTDDEFTRTCMSIFTELGFQMIVATPIKSVMTLEEFVGGAVFVKISQRHISSVLIIDYDTQARRLKLSDSQRVAGSDEGA